MNPEPSFDARMEKFLPNKGEQIFHYSLPDGTTGLVDAFVESIYKNGGEIQLNTDITKINLEDGKVHSVETSHGETILADVVVASGGAKETFLHLVGEDHLSPEFILQVNELPLMDSIFMVHLGLDFDPTPYTGGVCTYYYGTYDIEGGIVENQQHRYHQGRLGFVTHSPSLRSDNMAPAGCHALTIYTICPNQLAEGDWLRRKNSLRIKLFSMHNIIFQILAEHILVREILTPLDFRQLTHTGQHAFGGLSPVMTKGGIPHRNSSCGLMVHRATERWRWWVG